MREQRKSSEENRVSATTLAAATSIVLLAFVLRAYRIAGQSLWYDEGISATLAPRSLPTITVNAAADIHPPLYYYLLHFWASLTGTGELSLRWLSLMFGVLLVVLVYKIAEDLLDSRVALVAGFLAGTSPLLIYYSQEARMYMQTASLGAASALLFLRLVTGSRRLPEDASTRTGPTKVGWWVAYVIVTAAFLYSHYFAFTLLIAQNLYFSGRFLALAALGRGGAGRAESVPRRNPGDSLVGWQPWVASQVVVVLSFVPWLLVSFSQMSSWPGISESFDLPTLLRRVFLVFNLGLSWEAAATPNRELVFLVLLGGILVYVIAVGRHGLEAIIWPALHFLVPVLAMYFLSLRRPMYNPKFLLLATPGYYVLLSAGLIGIAGTGARFLRRYPSAWRWALSGAITVAFLSGVTYGTWQSTAAYYNNAKYARDDYRGLTAYIEALAEPGDAIVLNAPGQIEIFEYYFKGNLPRYPLPRERPIDEANTARDLESLAEAHDRVWLVLWAVPESDPRGFIEHWLDDNAFKASNRWFGNVRLGLYALPKSSVDAPPQPADVNFGNKARLAGFRLGKELSRPGDVVDLTLYWQALSPMSERYTVFAHILDHNEYLWGQRDSEPGGGSKITTGWEIGKVTEDRHGVPILVGTPPGTYQLEIGLYEAKNGRRLPILGPDGKVVGDRFLFGSLRVVPASSPPNLRTLMIQNPLGATFGTEVRLIGYDFHRLGFDRDDVGFRSGDIALLTLYWQAPMAIAGDYAVSLTVLDKTGSVVAKREVQPAEGSYPTVRWQKDEVIRDQHKLPLRGLSPGEYVLTLGLNEVSTGNPALPSDGAGDKDGRIEITRFTVR